MIAIGLVWVGIALLIAYAHHRARMRRAQQPPEVLVNRLWSSRSITRGP